MCIRDRVGAARRILACHAPHPLRLRIVDADVGQGCLLYTSFALGRDLADQHVVGADFGADVGDAGIVQAVQLRLSQVADVARDFFRTELGVSGDNRQFLDVNRAVAVIGNNLFVDQDRVCLLYTSRCV